MQYRESTNKKIDIGQIRLLRKSIGWEEFGDKQKMLEEYIEYYNTVKKLPSDSLNRAPREISLGITSVSTNKNSSHSQTIWTSYGQTRYDEVNTKPYSFFSFNYCS